MTDQKFPTAADSRRERRASLPPELRFNTIAEISDRLDCDVSTVWRNIKSGNLPQPVKICGRPLIAETDFLVALDRAKAERDDRGGAL